MKLVATIQDLFGVRDAAEELLRQRIPLTALPWTPPDRPQRVISSLELDFVTLDATEEQSHQHEAIFDRPVLNIFMVKCDDAEIYKSHTRQLIREWHNKVVSRSQQEWLILHVIQNDTAFGPLSNRSSGAKFLSTRSSVYDKIRSDFNSGSRNEHCAQLRLGDSKPEMDSALNEVVNRLGHLLLLSLTARVENLREDVRKAQGMQQNPGWNFNTFFVQKEALALTYLSMSLYEDSLVQYDELSASFQEGFVAQKNEDMGLPGARDMDDIPSSIFATEERPSRDLILHNKISTFDFQLYIISRQALLLEKMESYHELLERGLNWIPLLGRCTQAQRKLQAVVISCFSYSSCEELIARVPNNQYSPQFASARGDLQFLQLSALLRLGEQIGYAVTPSAIDSQADHDSRLRGILDILGCLSSQDRYLDKILMLTENILVDFKYAGRMSGCIQAVMEKAKAHALRAEYPQVVRTLDAVFATQESEPAWSPLIFRILPIYVDALVRTKDFTKAVSVSLRVLSNQPDSVIMISLATSTINKHSSALAQSLHISLMDIVGTDLSLYPEIDDTGICLVLCLENFSEHLIQANNVRVTLLSPHDDICVFQAPISSIPPGKSLVKIGAEAYLVGLYQPRSIEICWGQVVLERDIWHHGTSIYMPSHPLAPHLSIEAQSQINLAEPRCLRISLRNRTRPISNISITLSASTQNTRLLLHAVKLVDTNSSTRQLQASPDGVLFLTDLRAEGNCSLYIPIESDKLHFETRILLDLKCYDNGTEVQASQSFQVDLRLPISVNVQDFFRKDRLQSRFQISCSSEPALRILQWKLHSSSSFETIDSSSTENMVLLGAESMSRIFTIVPTDLVNPKPLLLSIAYRPIVREIWIVLEKQHSASFKSFSPYARSVMLDALKMVTEELDVTACGMLGRIHFIEPNSRTLKSFLNYIDPAERKQALGELDRICKSSTLFLPSEALEQVDYVLEIPVEIPRDVLVHTVMLQDVKEKLFRGETRSCVLSIETSTDWCARRPLKDKTLAYEVLDENDTWAFDGQRRGQAKAQDRLRRELTLIATQTGTLLYPSIDVRADDTDLISELHLKSSNSEVMVITKNESVRTES